MSNEMKEWLRDKEMEKKYIVDESTLIELLYSEMWKDFLDRVGTDYYRSFYLGTIEKYAPKEMRITRNTTFHDVAKARIASGEFEELKENG